MGAETNNSNESLGVSQEYDRKKYDNVYKRKKFKEEYFGSSKTSKDYITGETIHINTIASKKNMDKIIIRNIQLILIILFLQNRCITNLKKILF